MIVTLTPFELLLRQLARCEETNATFYKRIPLQGSHARRKLTEWPRPDYIELVRELSHVA